MQKFAFRGTQVFCLIRFSSAVSMQSYVRDAYLLLFVLFLSSYTGICAPVGVCVRVRGIYCLCVHSRASAKAAGTDRSELSAQCARGKPLIKQRDRNWPSWWYNLYAWNTQRTPTYSPHIHTYTSIYICHPIKCTVSTNACTYTLWRAHVHKIHTDESVCRRETISQWAREHFHLTIFPSSPVSVFV